MIINKNKITCISLKLFAPIFLFTCYLFYINIYANNLNKEYSMNSKWTYDLCKEEALKYSKRNDLKENNVSCYRYCVKNKLMDEFFPDSITYKNNEPEKESYSKYLIDNRDKYPYLFCKECGSLMVNESVCRNIIRGNNIKSGDGCVINPKTINHKKYNRVRCFDCFKEKYGRKHKPLNTVHKDFVYLFDIEESEIKTHLSLVNAITLENCIRKHGKAEGTKMFNDYCDKQAYSNSFEYKKDKHGWTLKEYDEFNKSRSVTLENCISRHGKEEGTKMFNDYCEKQSYVGCKEEYFIEKYGKEEGKLFYKNLNKTKLLIKENFIRKHGEYKGSIRWDLYKERRKSFSNISCDLFDKLGIEESMYGTKGDGEYIIEVNDSCYLFDYYVPSKKKVIEFFGDYWHGNPSIYNENDKIALGSITAKDKWDKDKERINYIESLGIDVLVVWESDYKKDKEGTVNKCKLFLEIT